MATGDAPATAGTPASTGPHHRRPSPPRSLPNGPTRRSRTSPPKPSAAGSAARRTARARREALRPLERGERPPVVTVGACFAALVAAIFWVSSLVALLSDATINGKQPNPAPLALFAVIMSAMAWGMWKARYWAVLGFQMLLVLFLLAAVAGIVNASTWLPVHGHDAADRRRRHPLLLHGQGAGADPDAPAPRPALKGDGPPKRGPIGSRRWPSHST